VIISPLVNPLLPNYLLYVKINLLFFLKKKDKAQEKKLQNYMNPPRHESSEDVIKEEILKLERR
jgi:hypothetical protein